MHSLEEKKQTAAAVTFHPVEHIPLFHSTIPFHHSSPVIVDYPSWSTLLRGMKRLVKLALAQPSNAKNVSY